MTPLPLLYIAPGHAAGTQNDGWSAGLPAGIPAPGDVLRVYREHGGGAGKLALLLEDSLLHPLAVRLDERPGKGDLRQFLQWQLKRFLPFPAEQAELRYLPLGQEDAYLTFSLHKPFVDAVHTGFEQLGVRCGFIGGLFTTLLENNTALRGRPCLALFDDCFLWVECDKRGHYTQFRSRRLPFRADGSLDEETVVESDLAPLLEAASAAGGDAAWLFDCSPARGALAARLAARLAAHGDIVSAGGSEWPLPQRFRQWLEVRP